MNDKDRMTHELGLKFSNGFSVNIAS